MPCSLKNLLNLPNFVDLLFKTCEYENGDVIMFTGYHMPWIQNNQVTLPH